MSVAVHVAPSSIDLMNTAGVPTRPPPTIMVFSPRFPALMNGYRTTSSAHSPFTGSPLIFTASHVAPPSPVRYKGVASDTFGK